MAPVESSFEYRSSRGPFRVLLPLKAAAQRESAPNPDID
jgi:hypothetical protein